MPNWVSKTHADGPTGGFGGALYGATKRRSGAHADSPTGGFGGALYGATKRRTGWGENAKINFLDACGQPQGLR
eukprot:5864241-Pyramimonas_sp.AAC.1